MNLLFQLVGFDPSPGNMTFLAGLLMYPNPTLLNTLMHNYNNYLYNVVFIQVMTLYLIKLCNCSLDCMYIIMYFWPYGLWPSGLNKLSCLVLSCLVICNLLSVDVQDRSIQAVTIFTYRLYCLHQVDIFCIDL